MDEPKPRSKWRPYWIAAINIWLLCVAVFSVGKVLGYW